jgi:hypothetical protein
MKIELNELDHYTLVNLVISVGMFLFGMFFDWIANVMTWTHNETFSAGQILWCGLWGIKIIVDYVYLIYYGK